jgi:hypothetical protein
MSRSLTAWSRWVSLAERSRSIFAFNYCVQVSLSASLLTLPLTAVSGKSRLLSTGFRTKAVAGVELLKEAFASRAR